MSNRYSLFVFVSCLLAFQPSEAQKVGQSNVEKFDFSLPQCVDYALKNNVSMLNANLDKQAAQARIGEIKAVGLPQIDASANLAFSPKNANFFPARFAGIDDPNGFVSFPFNNIYNANTAITLTQLLFDGSYSVGLTAARTYEKLIDKQITFNEQTTIESVTKAYYSNLVAAERINLLKNALARLDSNIREMNAMYKQGLIEKLDIDRLKVARNSLLAEQQKVVNLIALSNALLKFQMGMPVYFTLNLTDRIDKLETEKNMLLDDKKANYDSRPEYNLLSMQKIFNELDLKATKRSRLPRVIFGAQLAGITTQGSFSKFVDVQNNWAGTSGINLIVQVPIFSGGRTHYKAQQQKITIQKTQNDIQNLENAIDFQITSAKISLKNALSGIDIQKQNLELAKEVLRVTQIKYKEGVGSNIEVTTAESAYRDAATNYYASLLDVLIAKVDLDKAKGILK